MLALRTRSFIRSRTRFFALIGGCIAASVVLSGCLASVDSVQEEFDGPVTVTSVHCLPQLVPIDPTDAWCLAPAIQEAGRQYLLAYRLDDALGAPETIATTAGQPLTFRRSDQYSEELNTGADPGAGAHWVGYIADVVNTTTFAGFRVAPKFPLHIAEGHDAPVSVDTIVTLGLRAMNGLPGLAPVAADDPVTCSSSADIIAASADERRPRITAFCSLDDLGLTMPNLPGARAAQAYGDAEARDDLARRALAVAPDAITSYNQLAKTTTSLFGATITPGAAVDVAAGAAASTRFDITGRAPIGRSQDVAVQLASSIPGATVTGSRAAVTIANGAPATVDASVTVPAGTAAGSYSVTLRLVSGATVLRAGTATIRVTAPPVVIGGGDAPQAAAFVAPTPKPKPVRVDRTPPHFKSISWPKRMTRKQLLAYGITIKAVQTERADIVTALAHFETERGRTLTKVGMTTTRTEKGRTITFNFRPTDAGWKVLGTTGGKKLRITFVLTDKAGHTWTVKRPVMLF